MPKKQNYYQILGVSRNATLEEIRKAYHRLALQYHPDVNPDGQSAEAFKEITRIYELLTDPIARKDYDRELAKQLQTELEREISDRETKINSQQHRAWEFYRQGLKKSQKLNYRLAIADYTQALELNPQLVAAHYQRGFARSQLSDHRGAFADYTAALKLNPDLPEIYYYRGLTRFKLANIPGSLEDFDRATALNPHYGEAYYQRGLVYQEIDEKPAAIANFQQGLQEFDRQGDRFNYRRTLKALENIQKTLKFIDQTPPLFTLPLDILQTWRRFALNPIEGLFPAFITLGQYRAIAVAIAFSLIFNFCFVVGISHWQNFYPLTNLPIFTIIIIGLLPVFSLTGASGLMRIIFQANGSFAGDLFIASASLPPLGFWVLLGGLSQNWLAVIILGIFAISYAILTIYSGCHEISHMSAAKSTLTVPIMLLLGMLPLILIFGSD